MDVLLFIFPQVPLLPMPIDCGEDEGEDKDCELHLEGVGELKTADL